MEHLFRPLQEVTADAPNRAPVFLEEEEGVR
jgi:hypothetical protein